MQSQYAFHDQHWFGRNVVPAIYAQVPRKVVDGSLDGLACGIIPNLLLQQLDVDGIRRVVVLLGSFLQRKMVHLNGVDFHREGQPRAWPPAICRCRTDPRVQRRRPLSAPDPSALKPARLTSSTTQ